MESLAATDLTFSQFRTLCALGCHSGPMPVNALADRVQLSFAAAGRTVDKLVSSGLVDRREDPADRRVKRISLTAEGQSFLESHFAVAQEPVRRFVSALPAELRDNLRAALSPIVDDEVDYFRAPAESGHRAP
nr:MarR family transcriptional regulator [Gordonia jinghuaiqii]